MRLQQIEARLAAIRNEIETRGDAITAEELDKLETETKDLIAERTKLLGEVERRNGILNTIAQGAGTPVPGMVQRTGNQTAENADPFAAPEYRTAWLKQIRRLPLTEAEQRAYANATGTGEEAIPTHTANEIVSKVKTLVPLLNEVELLHVRGAVKFVVEGTNNSAAIHTENAAITAAADTLTTVTLSGFEIVKLIQISDTVMTMSITAFENWLVSKLAENIAYKIENLLVNGTGTAEPKGIDKGVEWGETNSVSVAASGSLTSANVQALIGLLPAAYDRNAKFAMNKKTLFTDFMPLQDNSKNSIVTVQNGKYFVYGYPVMLTDVVTTHEAFLGDWKKMVANLAENVNVKSAYDIDHNAYKYSGIAIFDCTVALSEAFVKLAKKTS